MQNIFEYIQQNKASLPENLEEKMELFPTPNRKLEAWKYFPVKDIKFSAPATNNTVDDKVQALIDKHKVTSAKTLVFLNGSFLADQSDKLSSFQEVKEDDCEFSEDDFESSIDLATLYLGKSGFSLELTSNESIQVLQIATEATSFYKNRVVVAEGVEASLYETQVLINEASLSCYTECNLAKASNLKYFSKSVASENSQVFNNANVNIVAQAKFESLVLDTDPARIRRRASVNLLEETAEADLKGFYLVNKKAVVNHKLDINHMVPNCISKQLYKGILDDASRVSFDGIVYVAEGAVGTDSEQLNKSMLFSNTAELDTRPQLEIYNDDVTCAHGATLGGFNTDEVFYLQSRCIPEDQAVAMLAFGFAEDIFTEIEDEEIHAKFSEQFVDRFKDYKVELNEF